MVDGRTRTGKVVNQLKQGVPQRSIPPQEIRQDFGGMFIPNHSGISSHPEFKKALSTAGGAFDVDIILTLDGAVLTLNGNVLILQ